MFQLNGLNAVSWLFQVLEIIGPSASVRVLVDIERNIDPGNNSYKKTGNGNE